MLEEQRWLHKRAKLPIFADESCLHPEDIPKIADAYDGIVVKLDKAGGYLALLDPSTNIISAFVPRYPPQPEDVSYGRDLVELDMLGFFITPTPGAPNKYEKRR